MTVCVSIFEYCNILSNGSFFSQGALNLSLSKLQPQPPNNRTIQNFVKDYVDQYVGGYPVLYFLTVS